MKYYGLDLETVDPYLKTRGKVKERGSSVVFGCGKVIVTGIYNAQSKSKKAYEGDGGDSIRKLYTDPDAVIVGANIPYDIVWDLFSLDLKPEDLACKFIDVQIVESLIDEYQPFSLDDLAVKYLNEHKGKERLEVIAAGEGFSGDFRQHLGELWDLGYHTEIKDYVISDADQPVRIWFKQKEILEQQGLMPAFEMNMKMIKSVVAMKYYGVNFDFHKWLENCNIAEDAYELLKKDYEGKYGAVNINSPKQLAVQLDRYDVPYKMKICVKGWKQEGRKFSNKTDLFEGVELYRQKKQLAMVFQGITLEKKRIVLYINKRYADRTVKQMSSMGYEVTSNPSINKDLFKEVGGSYEIISDLATYKQAKNLIDKFLSPAFGRFIVVHIGDKRYPAYDDNLERTTWSYDKKATFRIHGSFNIVGARQTGRLSGKTPNLQQVSSKTVLWADTDREVNLARMCRECFIAEKGGFFLKQDYAAQENRLAAHFAPGSNGDKIRKMYNENPDLDEHQYVVDVSGLAEEFGAKTGRKYAKNLRFGVCLSSDSLYTTAAGAYTGKAIVSEKKPLLDLNGNVQDYKSYLFHSNGLEFELSNGVKFVSTTEHLFIDCESIEWRTKRACEMKTGDRVPLAHLTPCQGSEWTLEGIKLDPGMAYLAGLYLGDGHVDSGVKLITHKDNTDYVLDILSAHDIHYTLREEAKINRVYLKQSEGVRTQRFFMNFGVGCKNKLVPDFIFSASYSVQLYFLAGLIDSDGCITKCSARVMNCNETLMRGVAKLCAVLGMNAHWSICHHKEAEKKDEYVLDIHDTAGYRIPVVYRTKEWQQNSDYCGRNIPKEQLEKFRTPDLYKTNVCLYDYLRGKRGLYEHNSWLPEGVWQKDYSPVKIISIRPVEDAEFTFVETDSHYYVANGFATHNCYGMGVPRMMKSFGWAKAFAESLYDKVSSAAPWLFDLMDKVQEVVLKRRFIRTIMGRRIHLRAKHDNEAYAFMNYLIQGSASDMTKNATNRVTETKTCELMVLTVHDENVFSLPCTKAGIERALEIGEIMETSTDVSVPMLSEPEIGTSWADGVEYDKAYGTRREFITAAVTAIKENKWEQFRRNAKAYLKKDVDDMTFSEFCYSMEDDEDEAEEA